VTLTATLTGSCLPQIVANCLAKQINKIFQTRHAHYCKYFRVLYFVLINFLATTARTRQAFNTFADKHRSDKLKKDLKNKEK